MGWKLKVELAAVVAAGTVLAITEVDVVGSVFVILVALVVILAVTAKDEEKKE